MKVAARDEIGTLRELLNRPDVIAAARGYLVVRDPLEMVKWLAGPPLELDEALDEPLEESLDFLEGNPPEDRRAMPPTTLASAHRRRWDENPEATRQGFSPPASTGVTRFLAPAGEPPGGRPNVAHMSDVSVGTDAAPIAPTRPMGYPAQANGVPPAPQPPAAPPPPFAGNDVLGRALSRYLGG